MKKIEIAVPWNNASYLPCNGFHPLYQALFDDPENTSVKFNVVDELELANKLSRNNFYSTIFPEVTQLHDKLTNKWKQYELGEEFLRHVSAEDFWMTSSIPGEIELHHTSPLSSGERPFVLHCESFLPVFMPFAHQGRGRINNHQAIRTFYRALLADDICVGIYSHLPETLDDFMRFFHDAKLESKLHLSRTGLADSTFHKLDGQRTERDGPPRFLFTSSAHQQPVAFKLRGGFSALGFAYKYLNDQRAGEFIFRCARPTDADLHNFGINLTWLREAENAQQIIWVEGFRPEREQLALFRASDIFLLPSVNLHSVSIMQAQLAGAIPVVTDTIGTSHFVTDGETGIIIPGVKEAIWSGDRTAGVIVDDHSRWSASQAKELAEIIYRRVIDLLGAPSDYEALRRNMRTYAASAYSGTAFRGSLLDSINSNSLGVRLNKDLSSACIVPLHRSPSVLFTSPPVPSKELAVETAHVFQVKGLFWLFAANLDYASLRAWSVIHWANQGILQTQAMSVSDNLGALAEYLLPLKESGSVSAFFQLENSIKQIGVRYHIFGVLLQRIYPKLKPYLLAIEKSLIKEEESLQLIKRQLRRWARNTFSATPVTYRLLSIVRPSMLLQLKRYRLFRPMIIAARWLRITLSIFIRLSLAAIKGTKKYIDNQIYIRVNAWRKP